MEGGVWWSFETEGEKLFIWEMCSGCWRWVWVIGLGGHL